MPSNPKGGWSGRLWLAGSGSTEAEIAFFVHQDFRQRRIGTRLVSAALDAAPGLGYQRIWASVYADNVPALRLLHGCGFLRSWVAFPYPELELLLARHPALPIAI